MLVSSFMLPPSISYYLLVWPFHSCNGLDLNPLEEILSVEVLNHFEPSAESYGLQVHH